MTFDEWLDQERGRLTMVAQHFGLTLPAVTQWRTNGVPVYRMRAIQDLTGGEVTLDEMVPDES